MKKDGNIIRPFELETVADGALRAGVSPSWIYQLIKQNRLDYYEIGGRKFIHRREIDGLIQQRAS